MSFSEMLDREKAVDRKELHIILERQNLLSHLLTYHNTECFDKNRKAVSELLLRGVE